MPAHAGDVRADCREERSQVRADVSRAEHEHVRSGGRRNLAEVVPLVAMLQVAVAGELLHDGEDLCKEVLRDRLAVGARCAAEHGACRRSVTSSSIPPNAGRP